MFIIITMLRKNHTVFCLLSFHLLHYRGEKKKEKKPTVAKYHLANGQKAGTDAKGKSLSDKTGHQ